MNAKIYAARATRAARINADKVEGWGRFYSYVQKNLGKPPQ